MNYLVIEHFQERTNVLLVPKNNPIVVAKGKLIPVRVDFREPSPQNRSLHAQNWRCLNFHELTHDRHRRRVNLSLQEILFIDDQIS